MESRNASISITAGTIFKAVLILIGAWLIFELQNLVLVLLTAIVLASAIEPAVEGLVRRKVPRVLGVLFIYVLLFGTFFGVFFFFVPSLFSDLAAFIAALPVYLETFNQWVAYDEYANFFGPQGAPVVSTDVLMESMRSYLGAAGMYGNAFSAIANIFGGVLSFLLIVVFSFYFAVMRTGVDDFLRVVTPLRYQEYVLDLWDRSRRKIGLWMQGQLLLAVIVGTLVYLGLTILGVKHALLLAVIAALFEIIPVFGPILAAIPAIVIALIGGGFTLGLLTTALYVIVQQFENHLIYPLVVTRVVGVPPLLVILSLLVGGQLAGFLGVLLSVPIAATIQELAKDIRGWRMMPEEES